MKAIRALVITMSAAAGLCSDAHAQFVRGGTNSYGQSTGGALTGVPANGYDRTGSGKFNGAPLLYSPFLLGGQRQSPYTTSLTSKVFGVNHRSGYTTGGAGAFYSTGPNYVSSGAFGPANMSRSAFDRWAVDRDRTQSGAADDDKKRNDLHRALTNPTPGEISSGAALNPIVDALGPLSEKLKNMPPTAIDGEFMKRIDFALGSTGPGILRQQGKIDWPKLILNLAPREESLAARGRVETALAAAYSQAASGVAVDSEDLKALRKAAAEIRDLVSAQAHTLTFAENVEIKRYLNSLEETAQFLKSADAARWLPGQPRGIGDSLQQLVLKMRENNARFAPAPAGREASYTTLHRALVALYTQAIGLR